MTTGAQEQIPGKHYDYGGAFLNAKHLDVGAKGDGVTDDTTALQNAINLLSNFATPGGGMLFLPAGTYIVSQLKMTSKVVLCGAGWHTVIKQKAASANLDLIIAYDSTQEHYVIRDLMLDGNKGNQSTANNGIMIIGPGLTSNDAHALVENVWINSCKGHGIAIGSALRESRFLNIWVRQCDGYGVMTLNGGGTDNFFHNITCEANGLSGFRCDGYGGLFSMCKAFGNGQAGVAGNKAGFLISGRQITLTNCHAQENPEHGFSFNSDDGPVYECTGAALFADSNGGNSFYFKGAHDIVLVACHAMDSPPLAYHPNWAVYFEASSYNCYIQCHITGAFIDGTFEFNGEADNCVDTAEDGLTRYNRFTGIGMGSAGGDEHTRFKQKDAVDVTHPYYTHVSEFTSLVEFRLQSWDGVTAYQYYRARGANFHLGQDGAVVASLPVFTNGNRPTAAGGGAGAIIFNSTTGKAEVSDGAAWNALW